MPAGRDDLIGERIARYRKLRGLTQRGLAMQANVAYGTLTKVESGHAVAQPVVVAAVARVLGVSIARLTGSAGEVGPEARLDELVAPLRVALDAYDLGPAEDVRPRQAAQVEADVLVACREIFRDGLIEKVAADMPALLDELGAHVVGGRADDRTWRALAHAYRCVQHVASQWGFRDLAIVALDRMSWAAARGSDPLVEALREHERAHEHLRSGQHRHGHTLLSRAERLADAAPSGPGQAALAGQGHLAAAIHAARAGDPCAADDHLARADELARRVGEVPAAFWLSFGPTNVALHRVAVLIERERHREAVAVADGLDLPARWHATRLGYHHMDLARAHAALGQHDRALRALIEARRIAPQQTRVHPSARRTVEQLLAARRKVPDRLVRYARWVGV